IVQGELPADGVDVGERGGGTELLRHVGGLDVAAVDGLLAWKPLLDVFGHPEHLDELRVVIRAVLHVVQVAIDRHRGDSGHYYGRDQDDGASVAHSHLTGPG